MLVLDLVVLTTTAPTTTQRRISACAAPTG